MNRFIFAAFVVIAAALAMLYFKREASAGDMHVLPRGRVVVPHAELPSVDGADNAVDSRLDADLLLSLDADEVPVAVIAVDFDGDGLDDQIVAIRKAGEPNIQIVIALYDSASRSYERAALLRTDVSQARTFSCSILDLTGEHRSSLIYQGVRDDGLSVLRAYFCAREGSAARLDCIADIESDGTLFVQHADRHGAYELSQSSGASFPIWSYRSDGDDQIQIQYSWSAAEQRYVAAQRVTVSGSSVAAKELAKIQDGTVGSFARYLDGLWYKTDSNPGHMRYIFFDRANGEIIFLMDDSEEVYSWISSSLRRNGIYLSTVNMSIQNLQRQFDISMLGLDDVRVHIQDDVRMLITESNVWDGQYRRVSGQTDPYGAAENPHEALRDFIQGPAWYSASRVCYIFDEEKCSVVGNFFDLEEAYIPVVIDGRTYIQFRKNGASESLEGAYEFSFVRTNVRRGDSDDVVENQDMALLRPARLSPDGAYVLDREPLILTRGELPVREDKDMPEPHEIVFLNR